MAENGAQINREEELRRFFKGIDEGVRSVIDPLITETAYIESELNTLRALPKIRVHPTDPSKQESTPAAKQYKEFLQRYTECIKVLCGVLHRDAPEQESPLRQWVEMRRKQNGGA